MSEITASLIAAGSLAVLAVIIIVSWWWHVQRPLGRVSGRRAGPVPASPGYQPRHRKQARPW